MCYDISFSVDIKQLSDYFPDLIFDTQIDINFNATIHIMGHTYGEHPIIYKSQDDKNLHCRLMEWGCIPFYVKDESLFKKQRATMLNARSERVLEDPKSYWYKIRNRRCLIPVSGFYEHRKVKSFKNKIPYLIGLYNQPMFFLPGLYSVVELPDTDTGEMIKRWTYTIITRPANNLMKMIHNDGDNRWRMPLLLPFELSKKWVSEELSNEEYKAILDYEMPSEELKYFTVWTIRSPKSRPDEKMKNEPFEWENLPELSLDQHE